MASISRSGAYCRFSWASLLVCVYITVAAGRRDLRVELEDKITGPDAKIIKSGVRMLLRRKIESKVPVAAWISAFVCKQYPINALVQVLLYDNGGGGACTGTLVAQNQVLTAGHCCVDPNRNAWPPNGFRILLGAYSIDGGGTLDSYAEPQTGGTVSSVSAVHVPPDYKTQDFWDVCVLTLTHADAKVKPAVLVPSNASANLDLISAYEYGWGIQQPFSGINSVNQLMGIELRTNSCAGHQFAPLMQNWPDGSPQWVCVDKPLSLGGACNGDSGGPLLVGNAILATLSAGLNTGNSTTFPIACDGPAQFTDIYINLAGPPMHAWLMGVLLNKLATAAPVTASPTASPSAAIEPPLAEKPPAAESPPPDSISPPAAESPPPDSISPPAAESPPPDSTFLPDVPPLSGESPPAGLSLPDTMPPPGSLMLPPADLSSSGLPPSVPSISPPPAMTPAAADPPPTGRLVLLEPPSEWLVQASLPPTQALPADPARPPPREPSREEHHHHHPDDSRHPGGKPGRPHLPPAPKHRRHEHGEEPPAGGVSRVEKGTEESPAPPEGYLAGYGGTPPAVGGDSGADGGTGGPLRPGSGDDPPSQDQDVPLPLDLAAGFLDHAVESIVQG